MKLRRKVVITLLSLLVMTGCGIGVLLGNSQIQKARVLDNNRMEQGQESDESVLRPGSEIVGENSRSEESATGGSQAFSEQELQDLEDYSQAPADNGCPYYVKVNRQMNVVTIYALDDEGYYTVPVKAMVCSVGKNDGTPAGTFQTSDKHSWCSLVGGVYGQYAYRIQGQIMFHSVPYYSMNKGNLETEEYNKLGEAASLGCIRLSVADAKWIYDNCPRGTIVTIYDSTYAGPLGKPAAERIDLSDQNAGWDPTDPDEANPWNTGKPRILGGGDRMIERGCTYQPACGVLAVDGNGKDITDQLVVQGTVDAMTIGEYPVTYQVQDEEGNPVIVSSVIRVVDTISPEIILQEEKISLNRIEASEANLFASISSVVTVSDAGDKLGEECIELDTHCLENENQGEFLITIGAKDASGNEAEPKTLRVLLDREAPTVVEPEQKIFTASSEKNLEEQLKKAIVVEDNYSGVQQVHVSWVWESSKESYTVLVTAKDNYGNVTSTFLHDFTFSLE